MLFDNFPEPLVYVTVFENEISELLDVLVLFLILTSLLEMLFILLDTLLDLRLLKKIYINIVYRVSKKNAR